MVSGASGWNWGRTESGGIMVKSGKPWDASLCVSEGTKDPLKALLEGLEARGEHVTCFTNLPNRGMADLVWEVLGEPAGVPAQWLGSFPPRETAFLGMHTRGSSKISQGWGWKHHPHFAWRTN